MRLIKYLFVIALTSIAANSIAQQDPKKQASDSLSSDTLIYDKNARPVKKTDTIRGLLKARSMTSTAAKSSGSSIETTQMAYNVDAAPTGASVVNVPIVAPAGVNGFSPGISLTYNSQGGNGLGGWGWNIGGLSAISRIGSTKYHDNAVSTVNFTSSDRFALDGQRLLLKTGTYGADGAEYQTETYSNLRIFSRGSTATGPAYFEVLHPDGSKSYYGMDANSVNLSGWAVSYQESSLGSRITYTYNNVGQYFYITSIDYGSIHPASALHKIEFLYHASNNSRLEQSFVGGMSIQRSSYLNRIKVTTLNSRIREYELLLGHLTPLGYRPLEGVREYSSDGNMWKAPIDIYYSGQYPSTTSTNAIGDLGLSNITSGNSQVVFTDLTGSGNIDFLLYPNAKNKFYGFLNVENNNYFNPAWEINTGDFQELFPVTWLTHNEKMLGGQGVAVVKNLYGSYKFDVLSHGTTAPFYFQYDRLWDDLPRGYGYYSECDNQFHQGETLPQEFISGDFNGDGLSDIIAISRPVQQMITGQRWVEPNPWDPPIDPWNTQRVLAEPIGGGCVTDYWDYNISNLNFINLDRRITTNFISPIGSLSQAYNYGDKLFTADFNGDGKTDILHLRYGSMYVYTLNETNQIELLWYTIDNSIIVSQLILLGDYNGDGKIDVMLSTSNQTSYATFISKGNSFVKTTISLPFSSSGGGPEGSNGQYARYLIPTDINGDGKTDIVIVRATTYNNSNSGFINCFVYDNSNSNADGMPTFTLGHQLSNLWTNLKHGAIPVTFRSDAINHTFEVGFLSDNTLTTYKIYGDQRSNAISQINQNGQIHKLEYKSLSSNSTDPYSGFDFYHTDYSQTFPNVDIEHAPSFRVLSKISHEATNPYDQQYLQQVFGYKNAVSNFEGKGFLGFGQVIKSNWHNGNSDPELLYNITRNKPELRGAVHQAFLTKYPYINVAMADMPTDNATISDYVTRIDYQYDTQILPNKVFINVPIIVNTKDLLNQTQTTQNNQYDGYFNILKSTINFGGGISKEEEMTYDNNLSGYYIGRPLTKKTTTNQNGSYTTQEEFSYSGNLPTQIKRKGNGTGWITEDRIYDSFGNITQSSISTLNSGTRSTYATYDPTGRFPLTSTDIEGLVTARNFDNVTGTLTSSTNPFGQTTQFFYDVMGRVLEAKDHLNNSNITQYHPHLYGGQGIVTIGSDGTQSTTTMNSFGNVIEQIDKTVLGGEVGIKTEYDSHRRPYKTSQPSSPGSYNKWNETAFDSYGRTSSVTNHTGKVISYAYNGLSMTVNDGTKSVTTTKNALAQPISVQDLSGTINYTYDPNGQIKTADYDGSVQSLEYDGWGRKTKLNDPSSGEYTYTYNDFSESLVETTPKGTTTNTYSPVGRLLTKTIQGDGSNMAYSYAYDNSTKLITSLNLVNSDGNNANYTYGYNANYQVSSVKEDNSKAEFTTSLTYDNQGRIATESYNAINKRNGRSASRTMLNTYLNGELSQSTDQTTGLVLSKINSLTATGQLASVQQGSSLSTLHTYDSFNMPQGVTLNKSGAPNPLLSLGYSFDAQKGNLDNRTHNSYTYNLSESFTYDNLGRLTHFNDINGNNEQQYDGRGRITYNSQLGNYTYSGVNYQQQELINLSPAADTWYQAHNLLQVSYNAIKQPININENGIAQIDFEYNAALQRSHRYYGNDNPDKFQRPFQRHYSEDGTVEITDDIVNNTTSFIFYLDGGAYSAPAIYKEVQTTGGTTDSQLYYLHRDHLGSIVMITNQVGDVVERRAFDAWGNILKLEDGLGNPLTGFVVLDRGYTGHEHLSDVGLIHMNGRLYDPRLHRFIQPDDYVQEPYNSQNYNRYGYGLNNPMIHADPTGNFFWLPFIIGAVIGAYTGGTLANNGEFNPLKWDYNSGKTWGYMLGGAAVGGLSGLAGGSIASGGGFFSNTAAIAASSGINSFGTYLYTGGKTDVSFSFGVGSLNLSTGRLGFLGRKGNSLMENLGYGFGALANVQDIVAGFHGTNVDVKARPKLAGHSETIGKYDGNPINISVGPAEDIAEDLHGLKWELKYVERTLQGNSVKGVNGPLIDALDPQLSTRINNVNGKILQAMTKNLNNGRNLINSGPLKYGLLNGCVNFNARALFGAGVLNFNALLPVTAPVLLNAELALRQFGMYASPFLIRR